MYRMFIYILTPTRGFKIEEKYFYYKMQRFFMCYRLFIKLKINKRISEIEKNNDNFILFNITSKIF